MAPLYTVGTGGDDDDDSIADVSNDEDCGDRDGTILGNRFESEVVDDVEVDCIVDESVAAEAILSFSPPAAAATATSAADGNDDNEF